MRTRSTPRASAPKANTRVARLLMSASVLATSALMLSAGSKVLAQAFQGTGTVTYGSANITTPDSSHTVVTLASGSPTTTINWAPNDTAVGGGPINFLPQGNTAQFTTQLGTGSGTYNVLNRIIPTDPTRAIALNGAVQSDSNVRVWLYSPGGLLIGSTASFNVGGLVLTAADPVTDVSGNYITTTSGTDTFSVQAPVNSQSAIVIQNSAQIDVQGNTNSTYMVAVAPQIQQGGTIKTLGSTALVATESANFTVDSTGLFNISVPTDINGNTAGTTVSSNTLTVTGQIGSADSALNGAASLRRVYLMAVPKNNAVEMAIAAGGNIGFDPAAAAQMDGNTVVLTTGHGIADTGSGNPIDPTPVGIGAGNITITQAPFTSNTYALASGNLSINDPATSATNAAVSFAADASLGAAGSVSVTSTTSAPVTFAGNASLAGQDVSYTVNSGTSTVGGALTLDASGTSLQTPGTASLTVSGSGSQLQVTGDTSVLADSGSAAGPSPYNLGGQAQVTVSGGTLSANGNLTVSANGLAPDGSITSTSATTGGTALVQANQAGQITVGGFLSVSAYADPTGTSLGFNPAANAQGGTATLLATDPNSSISATGDILVDAHAQATIDPGSLAGGSAQGGIATLEADNGATISVGGSYLPGISVAAYAQGANGGFPDLGTADGGSAIGGSALIKANGGSISTTTGSGIAVTAVARGGDAGSSGNGGAATGGSATIETGTLNGSAGQVISNSTSTSGGADSSINLAADASGGSSSSGYAGGAAKGGTVSLITSAPGEAITDNGTAGDSLTAHALGGSGATGGTAQGGSVVISAGAGSIAIYNNNISADVTASGGAGDSGNTGPGGAATGGTITIQATTGGSITVDQSTTLLALGSGGGTLTSTGGNATGGFIDINNAGGSVLLSSQSGPVVIDASASAGSGSSGGGAGVATAGTALISTAPSALLALGPVGATGGGDINIEGVSIGGNTTARFLAAGSIAVSGILDGGGGLSGAPTATAQLVSDSQGTGIGTVTLANSSIGIGTLDIYYNPASFGTPTDYSPAFATTTNWTGYQLVNSIDLLQQVGNYLNQNFALSRDIDARATYGWNGGTGFVPIGAYATPFTGQFDGLGHTVSNLYINQPSGSNVGLFGVVDPSVNPITIRNIGLINANITGSALTGALIGYSKGCGSTCPLRLDGDFSTGSVTGDFVVGGLVGEIDSINNVITNSHSDASVTLTAAGTPNYAGGLIGYVQYADISRSWATGAVNAPNGSSHVGGLIGYVYGGSITDAYASGAVTAGTSSTSIGGLVGVIEVMGGTTMTRTYATGAVNAGTGSTDVGGLVGTNNGSITDSYASGLVTAAGSTNVGGFVGTNNGTIANSYWDTYSTGQATGIGTDNGGTTTLLAVTSDPNGPPDAFSQSTYANFANFDANWTMAEGYTRPLGIWEIPLPRFGVATIYSAHALELATLNLSGTYRLGHDIDASGTSNPGDVWGSGGFLPIGFNQQGGSVTMLPFTGNLDGAGRVIYNLSSNQPDFEWIGLVAVNGGSISNIGLVNANLQNPGFFGGAGILAGDNLGYISGAFTTGIVGNSGTIDSSATRAAGGLVGVNDGAIVDSYSSATVIGPGGFSGSNNAAGGLVGINSLSRSSATISYSYANGLVQGASPNVGGLVGSNSGSVDHSYWDTTISNLAVGAGSGSQSGMTGLTTAQTYDPASYAGWSIDSQGGQPALWRIYQGQTTPLLKAFLSPVAVSAVSQTLTYNGAAPVVGYTTLGTVAAQVLGSGNQPSLSKDVGSTQVGYSGGLYSTQTGYDLYADPTPATITITPAALTLAAVSDSRSYDATTGSTGTVSVTGLQGSDTVTGLTQSFDSANAGSRTLAVNSGYTVNDGNSGGNYTVSTQTATGSITPAALTLSAVTDSRTYNATTGSTGVVSVSGLQGNDSVTGLTQSFDSANAGSRTLAVNSGYTVNDGNSGGNYTVSTQTATGSITPAALTLSAVTDSRTYNATTGSTGTVSVSGLQGNDSVTGLSQSFDSANAGSRTLAVNSGYTINDGNSGGNYTVSTQTASGSITPAALTLSAVADSRTYNATTGSTGVVAVSGLQGSDSVTGLTQSFDSANAGSRTLAVNSGYTVNDGNSGGNYTVSTQTATGSITPAALTLSAVTDSRTYNATTGSTGTVSVSGLQGNDSVTGLTQSFDSANAGSRTLAVNSGYTVNDGNSGGNYTISTQTATGSITPAALTVTYTANPVSSIYGNTPSGLTGSTGVSGLQGNDTATSVLSGTAAYSTLASGASNVGSYAITGSGLSGASTNYTYAFAQAQGNAMALTITARPITITADPQSQFVGNPVPPLTYTLTGPGGGQTATAQPALVNGDQLTGALATSATTASPPGSYPITQGTLAASSNYQVTYVGNTLTVNAPVPQTVIDTVSTSVTVQPSQSGQTGQTDPTSDTSSSPQTQQQHEDSKKAVNEAARPVVIVNTTINASPVTLQPPSSEPVTSNGNPNQWGVGGGS